MVVRLLWLSGRALAAQARGVLGSTPGDCRLFHFPLFSPHNIKNSFISSVRQEALSTRKVVYKLSGSSVGVVIWLYKCC